MITNYFTRMRFCSATGKLELRSKSTPNEPPAGYAPWYSHPHRKTRQWKIIFGHWAALNGLFDQPQVTGLDTGCVWGGPLTMQHIESGKRYQAKL